MSENKNDTINYIRLERNISYPFPTIVGILSIFIAIVAYSALTIGMYAREIYLAPGWNITAISEELVESVNTVNTQAIVFPFLNCLYVVILLAPLLVAFNLAQGYGNGQIRTLLSCPIRRRTVLLLKSGFVVFLISISVTIGVVLSLLFFYPFSIESYSVLIMTGTFWITVFVITSTCTLLAVTSRSTRITAFVGVGLFLYTFTMINQPSMHPMVQYLFFPLIIALGHVYPEQPPIWLEKTSLLDVFMGSGSAILFGIALLILSLFIFKRQEL
jgi:ABC-type transport system involved in multi-copper enzyme maturation permease subunit